MFVMKCSRLLRLGSTPSVKLLKEVIANVFLRVDKRQQAKVPFEPQIQWCIPKRDIGL